MAASVEARVPLLDHNLAELAFSVNSETNLEKVIIQTQSNLLKKLLLTIFQKKYY